MRLDHRARQRVRGHGAAETELDGGRPEKVLKSLRCVCVLGKISKCSAEASMEGSLTMTTEELPRASDNTHGVSEYP